MKMLRLLRLFLTAHAGLALAQPVLAGRFLMGDVDAIGVHQAVAFGIVVAALAAVVASLAFWLVGSGPRWPFPLLVVVLFADVFQLGMGFSRMLHVHVPLGSAIVTASVLLAGWSWSVSARQFGGQQ